MPLHVHTFLFLYHNDQKKNDESVKASKRNIKALSNKPKVICYNTYKQVIGFSQMLQIIIWSVKKYNIVLEIHVLFFFQCTQATEQDDALLYRLGSDMDVNPLFTFRLCYSLTLYSLINCMLFYP